jgi:mRNA-degrading endonuclease toxin of MazEF toxin-antitoxin module
MEKQIRRGQVWSYRPIVDRPGHIQKGPRPVVILSSDEINKTSPVILVAPCTAQPKCRNFPTQVLFVSADKISIALVHQAGPVAIEELEEYKFSLPEYIMEQFDKAIMFAFGISTTRKTQLDVTIDFSPSLFAADKIMPYTSDVTGVVGTFVKDESVSSVRPPLPASQVDKFYSRYPSLRPSESDRTDASYEKNALEKGEDSKKWTDEKMKDFVNEYASLTPAGRVKMFKKYGLANISVLTSYYYRFKKYLDSDKRSAW